MDKLLSASLSGLAGAVALNILHESVRRTVPEAPQVHKLGERSIAKIMEAAGQQPPAEDELYWPALAGDVLSNSLYYSLIGLSNEDSALPVGAALGALAGVGAVTLPGPMGLGEAPTNRTTATQAMTVGWYLFGGLVAAGVYRWLSDK